MIHRVLSGCREMRSCRDFKMDRVLGATQMLESRWQKSWLRCLEWECLLEQFGLQDMEEYQGSDIRDSEKDLLRICSSLKPDLLDDSERNTKTNEVVHSTTTGFELTVNAESKLEVSSE